MDAYEQLRVIGRGSYGCAILVRPRTQPPGSHSGGGVIASSSATTLAASSASTASTAALPHSHSQRLYVIKQISLAALRSETEHTHHHPPPVQQHQQQQHPQQQPTHHSSAVQLDQPQVLVADPSSATTAAAVAQPPRVSVVAGGAPPLRSPPHLLRLHGSLSQATGGAPAAALPKKGGEALAEGSKRRSGAAEGSSSVAASLLNEVQVLMRVGDGHPNICRYRGSFLASSSSSSTSYSSYSTSSMSAPTSPRHAGRPRGETGLHGSAGSPSRHAAAASAAAAGREDDMLCIVMDWYAGGDLSRKIKRRKRMLPPSPPAPLALAPAPNPAAAALTTLNDHIAARASTAGSSGGGAAHALTVAGDRSASSTAGTPPPPPPPPPALFAEDVVLDWLVQLLLGLHHIHARRVLHRDLKTSNIFISLERPRPHHRRRRRCATPSSSSSSSSSAAAAAAATTGAGSGAEAAGAEGEEEECVEVLRIGDFGIAKIMDHGDAMAKTRIGTPYYLAPEVVGGSSYSLKADLWSCGCSLFQMLTGSHAFGAAKNLNSLVVAILRGSPTAISPVYSPRMSLLLSALLQKDPARRPSADQLLSLPWLRARVPHWLSPRRIAAQFGTADLARLPEFSLAPTHAPSGVAIEEEEEQRDSHVALSVAASQQHRQRHPVPPRQPLTPQPRLPGSSSSSSSNNNIRSKPRAASICGSSSSSSASISAAASSYAAVYPSSKLLQLQHPPAPLPPSSLRLASSAAASATITSGGSGGSGGGGSVLSSNSTPSPLPALISRPLSLPPTPSVAAAAAAAERQQQPHEELQRAMSHPVDKHPSAAATPMSEPVATFAVRDIARSDSFEWHSLPPPLTTADVAPVATAAAVSVALPLPASPQPPPSLLPPPAPTRPLSSLHAPSSSPRLPPPSLPSPSPSLSLQCEQVRAYLEQQIDLPTLKQAYRLLLREHERSPPRCGRTAEADDANDAATVDAQKVLQLFHIGQTHLASLLQQLIAAERAQERADVRKAIAAVALPNSKLS